MQNSQLSPHEAIYLHEILSFKNTCAVKASAYQSLIKDQQLKDLVCQDISATKTQMQEIQGILNSTNY